MKIICIGRNYSEHIKELNSERPEEPVFFMKPDSAILLKNNPFYIPEFTNEVHYEVELLVKINRIGKHIATKFAHKYYDEIGLGIDFTARDVQRDLKAKGLPWEKAKAFDGSAVIGHFIPKANFENLDDLNFSLYKNNVLVQETSTKAMLWKIDELIAYVSQFVMLKIGDVIFTGTPSGVGKVETNDLLTGKIEDKTNFEIRVK